MMTVVPREAEYPDFDKDKEAIVSEAGLPET